MPIRLRSLLLCLLFPLIAIAEDAPDYTNATLTGDWGGARTEAWRKGLSWDAGLKIDALHNRGGTSKGGKIMTQLDIKLRADLNKLWGWTGGLVYLNLIDDRGAGINARHTGSLAGVSNIEVPVPTARVFHAWLQQSFVDDRVSLLAGIYPVDSEFFTLDSAAILLNPAYGAAADLALTRGPSIFNNAAFGLRAKWFSEDRTRYAMAALMDGIPNDPARPKATAIRFAKGDGAFVIAEFGWTPDEFGHAFEPVLSPDDVLQRQSLVTHEKYEGISKYAIGLWQYGSRVADQLDVDGNGDAMRRRSVGGYLLAERTLWSMGGDASRNLTAFARHTFNDGDSTSVDGTWNLGLRLAGPLASRPLDTVAIGYTKNRLSTKFRATQAAAGTDTAASEDSLEITWRVQFTRWFAVQPNLQFIRHPGGGASTPTARLMGARIDVSF